MPKEALGYSDAEGCSALHAAGSRGHTIALQWLLQQGASVDAIDNVRAASRRAIMSRGGSPHCSLFTRHMMQILIPFVPLCSLRAIRAAWQHTLTRLRPRGQGQVRGRPACTRSPPRRPQQGAHAASDWTLHITSPLSVQKGTRELSALVSSTV